MGWYLPEYQGLFSGKIGLIDEWSESIRVRNRHIIKENKYLDLRKKWIIR